MSVRDYILGFDDVESEIITVPQWGGLKIEVRSMSGDQRAHILTLSRVADGRVDTKVFNPSMVAACCYDPTTSERIFTDEDVAALGTKNSYVLERISRVAARLSGLGDAQFDEAGKDS